jgi:SAM-dependent methyltransferase
LPTSKDSIYKRHWDRYVEDDLTGKLDRAGDWPGDEWGDEEAWERTFQTLFEKHGDVGSWRRAVEIGQGSGKYTLKVLRNPDVEVRAYDVSTKFLEVCAERCKEHVDQGRLSLRPLDLGTPGFMLSDLADWTRTLDAFYSIDAMVHVDLQYLAAYLVTAAAVLKPGGKLIMSVGSATSEEGFVKLVADIRPRWSSQWDVDNRAKFEWLSGCMMEALLPKFGFELDHLYEPDYGIAALFSASLVRPEVGDELVSYLGEAASAS